MSDITPARKNVTVEESKFRAAVSEAYSFKIGASVNFINGFQNNRHAWHLNGSYSSGVGSQGPDGIFVFLFNAELVGISYYNNTTGTSGSTVTDIHWLSGGDTDNGTIFTTPPTVSSSAANNTYFLKDLISDTVIYQPTGFTEAVLSKTTFNQGDALRLDLDNAMVGANNFQVILHYRPI